MRHSRIHVLLAGCIAIAAMLAPVAAFAVDTHAYCTQQRAICRSLCSQVTTQGSYKRTNCDTGCDRSAGSCVSSGSYSFAAVEQYMPEFHKQ